MSIPTHETDAALIHELGVEYRSAIKSGDIERWISLWSADGVQLQPGGLPLSGVEQIRAALQLVMDLFDTELAILPENVRILGNWAYAYGTYKIAVTPKEGGEPISDAGMFLAILEKQGEGHWKIVITCSNNSQNH